MKFKLGFNFIFVNGSGMAKQNLIKLKGKKYLTFASNCQNGS